MTLQTLGQHSWNPQQNQQRFQLRQSERSSRLMTVRKTRRFKGFCVHGRSFGDAEANSLSEIQHLNQSKAVQQSVQFPAEGGTSQCCSCSYISRGENVKVPRVLPSWTYNSQSPECSSARLRGTSADPSCRQLLL